MSKKKIRMRLPIRVEPRDARGHPVAISGSSLSWRLVPPSRRCKLVVAPDGMSAMLEHWEGEPLPDVVVNGDFQVGGAKEVRKIKSKLKLKKYNT